MTSFEKYEVWFDAVRDVSFAGYRTRALLTQRFLRIGASRYSAMLFASMRGQRRETLQLEPFATHCKQLSSS